MKKLFISLVAVAITVTAISQDVSYTDINKSENRIFNRYGIEYTGGLTRYYVESGLIDTWKNNPRIPSSERVRTLNAYNKFKTWNQGYFKMLPTESDIIGDITSYSDNTNLKQSEIYRLMFNESRKIVGFFSKQVNDQKNNIQTIAIFEIYNSGMKEAGLTVLIDHVIILTDFEGNSRIFTYLEDLYDDGVEFTP